MGGANVAQAIVPHQVPFDGVLDVADDVLLDAAKEKEKECGIRLSVTELYRFTEIYQYPTGLTSSNHMVFEKSFHLQGKSHTHHRLFWDIEIPHTLLQRNPHSLIEI